MSEKRVVNNFTNEVTCHVSGCPLAWLRDDVGMEVGENDNLGKDRRRK